MKHGLKNLLDTKHELKGSLELSSYCDYFLRLIENDGKYCLFSIQFFIHEIMPIKTN